MRGREVKYWRREEGERGELAWCLLSLIFMIINYKKNVGMKVCILTSAGFSLIDWKFSGGESRALVLGGAI